VLAPTVAGVTTWLPFVGWLPIHAPDALQDVALPVDQVSVALWPATIVVGWTASEIVGVGAGGDEPPPP
jgi:hypothetical protein